MKPNKKISLITKEIIDPSIDIAKDYTEIGIDEILNKGLLKEIPVVKTLVAIIKTGVAINKRKILYKKIFIIS